jgi:hypothetical protein
MPGEAGTPTSAPSARTALGTSDAGAVDRALARTVWVGARCSIEVRRELVGDRCKRRGRVVATRDDGYRIAASDLERHDGHHAASVRLATVLHQAHVCGESSCGRRDHRGRPGVQPGLGGDDDRRRPDHVSARRFAALIARRRCRWALLVQRDLEHHVAASDDTTGARAQRRHDVHVRDHHLGEQTASAPRDEIDVETQEWIAGAHRVAILHDRVKAFSAQGHGIEADVDDDLEAERLDRHRVASSVDEAYDRIAWRDDDIAQRVDRDTVAREPLCEGRVRDRIERNENAGNGRDQRERAAIRCRRTGGRWRQRDGHARNVLRWRPIRQINLRSAFVQSVAWRGAYHGRASLILRCPCIAYLLGRPSQPPSRVLGECRICPGRHISSVCARHDESSIARDHHGDGSRR